METHDFLKKSGYIGLSVLPAREALESLKRQFENPAPTDPYHHLDALVLIVRYIGPVAIAVQICGDRTPLKMFIAEIEVFLEECRPIHGSQNEAAVRETREVLRASVALAKQLSALPPDTSVDLSKATHSTPPVRTERPAS